MAKCWRCKKEEAVKAGYVCKTCEEEIDQITEMEEERRNDRNDERWNFGVYSSYN